LQTNASIGKTVVAKLKFNFGSARTELPTAEESIHKARCRTHTGRRRRLNFFHAVSDLLYHVTTLFQASLSFQEHVNFAVLTQVRRIVEEIASVSSKKTVSITKAAWLAFAWAPTRTAFDIGNKLKKNTAALPELLEQARTGPSTASAEAFGHLFHPTTPGTNKRTSLITSSCDKAFQAGVMKYVIVSVVRVYTLPLISTHA